MPAKSKAQANLMAAAEHGASFPKAKALRASMTTEQLHDFAATPRSFLPAHTRRPTVPTPRASRSGVGHPHRNLGTYLHPRKR